MTLQHFLFKAYQLLRFRGRLLPQKIKMPGVLRTVVGRAVPALRGNTVIQRANLQTRPAKDVIGPVVSL